MDDAYDFLSNMIKCYRIEKRKQLEEKRDAHVN